MGDSLNESLATHDSRFADIVEHLHRLAERHAPDDGMRLKIDFEFAGGPSDFCVYRKRHPS
jgi:hypothetical protein